eukprot:TRINITY_DN49300_c0_g1_i1.p1 TRINITY_DN49300_c0_g1~~TRINITY_DN49300_c0_g1_i1.p1  ORF type:complete len:247 (+),score=44.99 TRINITY_DN49300_c0_g1_i1:91-831(+)
MYGLRLINNTATSNGSGTDWIAFGDPGFRQGKATQQISQRGRAASEVRQSRHKTKAEMRAQELAASSSTGSLPSSTWGPSTARRGLPGAAVIRRWQRAHGKPLTNDREGLIEVRPLDMPTSPSVAISAATARLNGTETPFVRDALSEESRFRLPTMPVPKYHIYSESAIRERHIPAPGPGDKTPPKTPQPDLSDKVPSKHYYFGDPMIALSNTIQAEHPSHGLSKSKHTWRPFSASNPSMLMPLDM